MTNALSPEQEQSYEALRLWRNQEARQQDVPPYLVFPNPTLREIALHQPQTYDQLAKVEGVSTRKIQQYGATIISLVNKKNQDLSTQPDKIAEPLSPIYQSRAQATGFATETVLSVTTLNKQILESVRLALNRNLGSAALMVAGEVADVRTYSDERLYFDLTDEDSIITCRLNRTDSAPVLNVGDRVTCGGSLSIVQWRENRWNILLDIVYIKLTTPDAKSVRQTEASALLEQRGFFDAYRHRELPKSPRQIALVTPPADEAGFEIQRKLEVKWPIRLDQHSLEWVQAEAVIEVIKKLDLGGYDLLIIATTRGRDVDIFDQPRLVETIANLKTPNVMALSSSGPRLSERAADVRCDTPASVGEKIRESWQKEPITPPTVLGYLVVGLMILLFLVISFFILKKLGIF